MAVHHFMEEKKKYMAIQFSVEHADFIELHE